MEQKLLPHYIALAKEGTKASVKKMMNDLNKSMSLATSKFIDYALGQVNSDEGFQAMADYLFHGTQIQRNYSTLYFCRRGEYLIVRQAFDKGLIDEKQAFSR